MRRVRVLDPACGSGNFLYLALRELKDLEHAVLVDGEVFGFPRQLEFDLKGNARPLTIGPEVVMGIDVNPMGVELARISVWIGFIQWMLRHGEDVPRHPILKSLETIEQKDALIDLIGGEERWLAPVPDVGKEPYRIFIVGNPPFVGDKAMLGRLDEAYVTRLRRLFAGRLPGGVDLVCYWFEKARALVEEGRVERVGLVSTNSIRGTTNRSVLSRIRATGTIYDAWSDEPWRQDGAAVRVSLVCFGPKGINEVPKLNGEEVPEIFSNLTSAVDLSQAQRLASNKNLGFQGPVKVGPFDVPGNVARSWLVAPTNPNGHSNINVIRPLMNGLDVMRRPSDTWIIDFSEMSEQEASLYEEPFEYLRTHAKPFRARNRDASRQQNWWRLGRTGIDLKQALKPINRYIATSRIAKHRVFVWLDSTVQADCQLVAITRDDDTTFGILHSRFHELWALRLGSSLEDRPRYTPSTTFEPFPFPDGLTPDRLAATYADDPRSKAIAAAAERLNSLREAWLNPSDLVKQVPEVVAGFPDRLVPRDAKAAAILKKRTLTNLYNERPAWLEYAHRELDEAVAAAYGWPADLSNEEVLSRLLAMNLERAVAQPVTTKKRATKQVDQRQLQFRFTIRSKAIQVELALAGGAAVQPAKRAKRRSGRKMVDRRQYHFRLVIIGGLEKVIQAGQVRKAGYSTSATGTDVLRTGGRRQA